MPEETAVPMTATQREDFGVSTVGAAVPQAAIDRAADAELLTKPQGFRDPVPEAPVVDDTPVPEAPVVDTPAVDAPADSGIDVPETKTLLAEMDAELENTKSQMETMKANMDASSQKRMDGIMSMYATRKKQMEAINAAHLEGLRVAGITSGAARFTTELNQQILTNEERAGIARLAELDAEEQRLLMDAEAAKLENDFEMLDKNITRISENRREKTQLVQQQFQNAIAEQNLMIQQNQERRQAARDEREARDSAVDDASISLIGSTDDEIRAKAEELGVDANLLKQRQKAAAADLSGKLLKSVQDRYNFAQSIPKGETFVDPDTGTIFIGTGKVDSVVVEEVLGGTAYRVEYDMSDPTNPRQMSRISLGQKWKGGGDTDSETGLTPSQLINETSTYINEVLADETMNQDAKDIAITSARGMLSSKLQELNATFTEKQLDNALSSRVDAEQKAETEPGRTLTPEEIGVQTVSTIISGVGEALKTKKQITEGIQSFSAGVTKGLAGVAKQTVTELEKKREEERQK